MSKLDEFIRSNRAAFDDKEPSGKIWSRISSDLFGRQNAFNALVYWRAAAVLFMGLSVFLLYLRLSESQDSRLVLNEFTNVESFYAREISSKIEMIENFPGAETGLNGYTHDFNQLEAMYEVLKEELKVRPSKKVKDALVLNLLVRVDLLNRQLEKLEAEDGPEEAGKEGKRESAVSI